MVKSFVLSNGYGFIESDAAEGNIFFPKYALSSDLFEAVYGKCFDLAGREVSFTLESKDGKAQAHNVRLSPGEGLPLVGKVKTYAPSTGYGFISAEALGEQDVFFMKTELPPSHQHSSSMQGTPVSFVIIQTEEGNIQAQEVQVGTQKYGWNGGQDGGQLFAGMDPRELGLAVMNGALPSWNSGKDLKRKRGWDGGSSPSSKRVVFTQPGVGASGKMSGVVKSFNGQRGWGFISSQAIGADIYFKSSDGSIAQGMRVEFSPFTMPDGNVQARDVVESDGGPFDDTAFQPPPAKLRKVSPAGRPPSTPSGQHQGVVKSFNAHNGWGFIDCDGTDIYFKRTSLPYLQQQTPDLVGSVVAFEVIMTADGKPQAAPGIKILKQRG